MARTSSGKKPKKSSSGDSLKPLAAQGAFSGFVDAKLTAKDFDEFNIELERKTIPKKNVEWDLRITFNAPKPTKDGTKTKPANFFIAFGNCFTSANIIHHHILVAKGPYQGKQILILMFDTDHPRYKISPSNVKITLEKNGKTMHDMHSNPIGKKIADYFGLHLPTKEGDRAIFHFKLHKIIINGLKGSNYFLELFHPTEEY